MSESDDKSIAADEVTEDSSEKIALEIADAPEVLADAEAEPNGCSTSIEKPVEFESTDTILETGIKRDRALSICEDVPAPEKKVAPRERRSRFSDKPPETTAADQSAVVNNIASIINAQLSGLQNSILSTPTQQPVTPKEQRELFVGNVLATGLSDAVLKEFLNSAMKSVGLVTGPEDPIVTCRMNAKFSFIELRTVEDSQNALNLNGIPFMGQCLKISRPSKYVGPPYQPKTWQEITGQAPLTNTQVGSADFVPDPATKTYREIFVGNTSSEMTDVLIKGFLGGALQEMGLSCSGVENPIVQVRVNGKFSFAEFRTMEEAANALNLNGIPFMNQSLKLSRPSKFEANTLCTFFTWDELLKRFINGELKLMTAGHTSRVIRIDNMVSATELNDSAVTEEVVQDTMSECSQFGKVVRVIIPRPDAGDTGLAGGGGIGKVFVEMSTEDEAKLTLVNLKGRKFDGKWVDVKFYPMDYFSVGNYGAVLPHSVVCTAGAVTIDRVLLLRGAAAAGSGSASMGYSGMSSTSSSVSAMMSGAMGMGMAGGNSWNPVPAGQNIGVGSIGGLRQLSPAELQGLVVPTMGALYGHRQP